MHYTHQGLYLASLSIKKGPWVRLGRDLQVEPTLLHMFSTHSKLVNTLFRTISLSWSLLSIRPQKMIYRMADVEGRGVWSTFYNPYALQNNYSVVQIPQLSRKKAVAKICFRTDKAWTGKLSGEIHYSNATLKLSLKSEPPAYITLNIQKIKTGTYLFNHAQGFYYSTQEGDATNGNGSSMHYIFYQQQSLFYLITIELVHLRWCRFHVHLYLNRKGALLMPSSEKDIEVHLFNSGPSFLRDSAYIVWFIPLQHPLLQHEWTFSLQLFDSRKENLLWSNNYTCKDQVGNAAHFIPGSILPFDPALYTGFVAKVRCTRAGRAHALLNATVNSYASKVIGSTVNCLQRICLIKRVKIQTPDSSEGVLHYSPRATFVLSANTQVNCPGPKQKDITWKIYKIPDVKSTPDWSKPLNPPSIRIRNLITLEIPSSSLNDGLYLFNFTMKLVTMYSLESVEGSDSVLVRIGSRGLVAVIAGGNFRTVGFSNEWTLDGSVYSDLDAALPVEGLTFTWYCTQKETDYVSMTLSRKGNCCPDQVDLKWTKPSDPVQRVQAETLQGNAVYYFRLIVQKESQIAQAEQVVHVLPGSLPILNITCIENCGMQIIPTEILPVGISSKQYALPVHVEVYDALGAHTLVTLQASVFGPVKDKQVSVVLNELHGLTSGPKAPVTSFLENEDYFSACHFVYMVASTLNDIDPLPRFHSSKTDLRDILLNSLARIPTTDILEAHQIISSISQITQEITELSRTSQLLAARKLKEVIENLNKYSNKDRGSKEIEVLGTSILAGLSNVLRASLLDHRNIHINGVKDTISVTEILADLILRHKVPGENETILEAKGWTITLRKDKKLDVSDVFLKRKDCKNFFYPHVNQEDEEGLPVDAEISTVLYEFVQNPFPWLPYSDDIGTSVTGFKMAGIKSNGDSVGLMPDRVEMIMTRKSEDLPTFEWRIQPAEKLPEIVGRFSFEVHRNAKDIFIQIVTKLKLTFQIFIHLGLKVSPPPIASFHVSFNKPAMSGKNNSRDKDCAPQAPYIFCLSQTLLKSIFQGNRVEKQNISIVLCANLFVRAETTQLIRIVLFTADCLYLDEVESHWKEDLCTSGPQTSWQKLHCFCTGKKRFSRSANPPPKTASEDYVRFLAGKRTMYVRAVPREGVVLTQTYKNPVTTLTLISILVAYIFLAMWTIRKDRADLESRDDVIVLPDNDPFDKVCYLVTIYTGSRLGSGTTADIFIQLIGRRSISDMHCLRHTKYATFGRGAIDTFLLTSKNNLGDVYSFRVWHNNGGLSPKWFLSRVKVENIYTKQSWMFICQKWLALEKGDGRIERTFFVTQPEKPLSKMNFFLISFASDLTQSHLWLSVLAPVCTGALNRLQRLSCCLAILLSILLFNIMFFNAEKEQHLPYLRPVIIGIQSAFIAIPLQMIVTALFKYSQKAPSPHNATQPKECSAFMSGNLRNWKERLQKWYVAETASKDPGDSSVLSKLKPLDKRRWTQAMPAWMNCTISEGAANRIAAEEDMGQDTKTSLKLSNNNVEKDSNPQVKPLDIPIMLFCTSSPARASGWHVYVSWMLVLVISTVASFFIIFYGLSYDYKTSLEWLTASTVALCGNVFLLETLNIAFFSTLKTLYPKYCEDIPWSNKQAYLEIKLDDVTMDADEMRELHYELVRMRSTKNYQPLEEDELTIFKKRLRVKHNAFVFIKDLLCHFVFLILILNIAYSIENTNSFYYNQNIYNKLSPGLWDVGKIEHVYMWLSNVFLPVIHNDYHPTYLSDTWSKILGLPRMRQIRAKNVTKECFYPHSFVNKFVISKSHCLHRYGHDPEEKRDYFGSWKHPANKSVSKHFGNFSGFIYQPDTDQWTYDSYGELNTYGAGGYTFNFYPEDDLPVSLNRIESLEGSNWLDENTWVLIVELTSFNPDVDLFCSISIVFETSYLGSINTSLSIHSYKLPLFKQLSKTQKFVYVAVAYILVFYVIDEIFVVHQQRLQYIKEVSNLINFGIKAVCVFFLLQLALKFKLASGLVRFYLRHPHEFIPFHKVCQVDQTLQITLAFLAFLIVLKTLRYSRFFYDVRLAQRSIYAALPGICSMALVVAVYFFVYMAFGYLVFGQHEWNYNTMTHSAQTVFSYCVSAFKDTAFTSNRVLGGLYLATFMMVMICVLINLFQAVIMSAYEDMKQPVYEEPSEEAEVVSFLVHKIRRIWFFITWRKPTPSHDAELFNRVLFGHPKRRNPYHLGLKARKINGRKMVYLVI
ncbi:polycystin family receptor for egg jelly [Tiliqua scincoides]|uniref:polycystin family receptor for egg jelly n=1 Tax=Tiliqua scincoides TaxID=71010 RepID=UPI0034623660